MFTPNTYISCVYIYIFVFVYLYYRVFLLSLQLPFLGNMNKTVLTMGFSSLFSAFRKGGYDTLLWPVMGIIVLNRHEERGTMSLTVIVLDRVLFSGSTDGKLVPTLATSQTCTYAEIWYILPRKPTRKLKMDPF